LQRSSYAHEHYRKATSRSPALDNIPMGASDIGEDQYPLTTAVPDVLILNAVPWDDRGIIYVRQGAPDTIVRSLEGSRTRIPENEVWIYERDTPPWVLPFIRTVGPSFSFAANIGCGTTQGGPSLARSSTPGRSQMYKASPNGASEARAFYDLLSEFDPRFQALGNYCGQRSVGGGNMQNFRNKSREIAKYYRPLLDSITHTESAIPFFRNRMRMLTAAYAFRDARGRAEVTALSWIPVADLRDSVPVTKLSLTYTLVNARAAPLRHDTIVAVPPSQGGGMLRTARTFHDVTFDNGRLLIVANDNADGDHGVSKMRNVAIASGGTGFGISDLVIGEPDADGLLIRGTNRISPLPDHAITSGRDFRLFYELYGLSSGDSVSTSITVTRNEQKSIAQMLRLYPGRKDSRQLTFSGKANIDGRGISVQDASVGGDLLPGAYTVEVTSTTPRGVAHGKTTLIVDPPRR
jgi:hypothetical protein